MYGIRRLGLRRRGCWEDGLSKTYEGEGVRIGDTAAERWMNGRHLTYLQVMQPVLVFGLPLRGMAKARE